MRVFLLICIGCFQSCLVFSQELCIDEAEQALYNQIMEYRKEHKLPSIPFSEKLTRVALAHCKDLMEHYSFDDPNRCNPHSWYSNAQWNACCYTNDHKEAKCMWDKPREITSYPGDGYEILYYHSIGAKANEALIGWKKSNGHNPLLINTGQWEALEWKAIGIAIHENWAAVWFGRDLDEENPSSCK